MQSRQVMRAGVEHAQGERFQGAQIPYFNQVTDTETSVSVARIEFR